MTENIVSAEIEPMPNKANQAAIALQRMGFKILHIGLTISVQGPQSLWESIFNGSFETRKKTVVSEAKGADAAFQKALTENMRIPLELEALVANVIFTEPPEFIK